MAYEDTEDYKNLMKAQAREDADANDPGKESTADFLKRTKTKAKAPRATVGGPRTVSKKELEASGLSLRDFLNKERGLTRRKDPVAKSVDKSTVQPEITLPLYEYNQDLVTRSRSPNLMNNEMTAEQIAAAQALTMPTDESKFLDASRRGQFGTMKKGGAVKKYKEGGTVSSASRRGDGIALRGKTRGKMV